MGPGGWGWCRVRPRPVPGWCRPGQGLLGPGQGLRLRHRSPVGQRAVVAVSMGGPGTQGSAGCPSRPWGATSGPRGGQASAAGTGRWPATSSSPPGRRCGHHPTRRACPWGRGLRSGPGSGPGTWATAWRRLTQAASAGGWAGCSTSAGGSGSTPSQAGMSIPTGRGRRAWLDRTSSAQPPFGLRSPTSA